MKKVVFAIFALAATQSAFAALPPYAQSAKEIKAILDNEEVARQLSPGQINSVTRTEVGYLVTAGDCAITVQVTYVIPPLPDFAGPAQLELHVGQANCLPAMQ